MSCGRFLQTEQLSFQGEAGRLLKRAKTLYQKRKMEFDETTIEITRNTICGTPTRSMRTTDRKHGGSYDNNLSRDHASPARVSESRRYLYREGIHLC